MRRILQRLLTNEMADKFNWIGSRGQKTGFKKSSFLEVVYGTQTFVLLIVK